MSVWRIRASYMLEVTLKMTEVFIFIIEKKAIERGWWRQRHGHMQLGFSIQEGSK